MCRKGGREQFKVWRRRLRARRALLTKHESAHNPRIKHTQNLTIITTTTITNHITITIHTSSSPKQELFPGGYAPTPAHFLLRLLADKGLLLRVFTQNIDGLEQLAGVPPERVVAAHGSFDSARCVDCGSLASVYAVRAAACEGAVCRCDRCGGAVKPDIVVSMILLGWW